MKFFNSHALHQIIFIRQLIQLISNDHTIIKQTLASEQQSTEHI